MPGDVRFGSFSTESTHPRNVGLTAKQQLQYGSPTSKIS
jgi:hypothetical protein